MHSSVIENSLAKQNINGLPRLKLLSTTAKPKEFASIKT